METGLTFELVGVTQERVDFKDREGSTVRGVRVAWMGGTHFFTCATAEDQHKFGDVDSPVRVRGKLHIEKGKAPKLTFREVDVLKRQKSLAGG